MNTKTVLICPKPSAKLIPGRLSGVSMMLLAGIVLVIISCAGNLAGSATDRPVLITVQGNQMLESATPLQGFLHGFDEVSYDEHKVNMDMLTALKPKYWRMGMSDKAANNYLLSRKLDPGIKLTLVLSDQLAVMKGGYQHLRPWEDWDAYQNDIKAIIMAYKAHNLRIDYWDVWSEPDTNAMWTGTCDQAMEMFKRTYETIRTIDATAKIVGPSISDLDSPGACQGSFFVTFIKYITENNLKFNAISWHEFDDPKALPAQSDKIRKYFYQHPSLGMPELHINEYSGPLDAPIPGWAVGWLYYLEAGNVSWASRACWEKGCQTGLDWLFQEDNLTPTPLYWVHRAYADLPAQRLKVNTDTPDTVAMAGKNDGKQELSLLVGRFSGKQQPSSPVDVNITIDAFPYPGESVAGMVKRIPNDSQSGGLPDGPRPMFSSSLPVNNRSVSVLLPAMQDGDAYTITLKPGQ